MRDFRNSFARLPRGDGAIHEMSLAGFGGGEDREVVGYRQNQAVTVYRPSAAPSCRLLDRVFDRK
jgi:hypothetical protein